MAADDDGLQDWAAEYDGEGQERIKKSIEFALAESPQFPVPHHRFQQNRH
jgi:hypothetical protein